MYGVIGDAHLGFKAYSTVKRTEESLWVFEQAVDILYNAGVRVVFIPGDLIDDTVWSNWVEKKALSIFRLHPGMKFIILAGNHDSNKTYSNVSALDVLEECSNIVILSGFMPSMFTVDGLKVLAIPHMKSQKDFTAALDAIDEKFDVCMLHCMVNSQLDLGPNDLNIDQFRLDRLSQLCVHTWIGHQHVPTVINEKVFIPGSTLELNFGELGARYAYVVNGEMVELLPLPQPRNMVRVDFEWTGINDALARLSKLDDNSIYKVTITSIPPSEYGSASAAMDTVLQSFSGDLLVDLVKTGHIEMEIGTIDATFDLKSEFKNFCDDNKANYNGLVGYLTDAISELASEEEDAL